MKKEEQSMNLTNYKLPVAELKADGSFYLDGAKIRAVQSYTIEGLRTDTMDAILTLKILVDPHLLIDNSGKSKGIIPDKVFCSEDSTSEMKQKMYKLAESIIEKACSNMSKFTQLTEAEADFLIELIRTLN